MTTVMDMMCRIARYWRQWCLCSSRMRRPQVGDASDTVIEASVDGLGLYQAHCAACHDGQVPRAPHMITFSTIGAETILNAMNNGVMRAQASALSATEREVLAGFLAGEAMAPPKPILACADPLGELANSDAAAMQGWGGNAANHRHSDGALAGLDRNNVDQLALKWVFAYPGALRARSQPLVHDGVDICRVAVGHNLCPRPRLRLRALDLLSGCRGS